ncbi:hypothetical protein M8J76_012915 [Diaphorina citri]|nr:hypothetical protein M8J76_012915 [Diaphorina citri]
MALYIGTLRFDSTDTESICITIIQDGQVFCLVSATCVTQYYSQNSGEDVGFNKILYDNTVYAELTDIRTVQMSNPTQNSRGYGNPSRNGKRSENGARYNGNNVEATTIFKNNSNSTALNACKVIKDTTKNTVENGDIFDQAGNSVNESLDNKLSQSNILRKTKASDTKFNAPDNQRVRIGDNVVKELIGKENGSATKELSGKGNDDSVRKELSDKGNDSVIVRPCLVYKMTEAEETLRRIFRTQDFKINDTNASENELFFQLASTVVIFGTSKVNLFPMLATLLSSLSAPVLGQPVLVVTHPFHHHALRYSWSAGIVSSILNGSPVFLTDASVSPGAESSPVFSPDGALLGIIICSLFRTKEEFISFSLGISLQSIFEGIVKPPPRAPLFHSDVSRQVVLVRCGNSWGSGIILDTDSGIVLTCQHLLTANEDIVISYLTESYPASVIFQTTEYSAFNVALLSTNCELKHALAAKLNLDEPLLGSGVSCVGYPVFNEHALTPISPTLSSGIISKLSHVITQHTAPSSERSSKQALTFSNTALPSESFSKHDLTLCSTALPSESPRKQDLTLCKTGHSSESFSKQASNLSDAALPRGTSNNLRRCVMIQTSCSVHSGASGGALLNQSGDLIGLVVCNVMDSLDSVTVVYPRVNMAVPICAFYSTLMAYLRTKDPSVLNSLNVSNTEVRQIWNLQPLRSKL